MFSGINEPTYAQLGWEQAVSQPASHPGRQSRQRTRRTYLKPLHKESCAPGSNGRIQTTHTKTKKMMMKKTTSKEEGDAVTGYFGVGRAGCVSAVLALVAGAKEICINAT